MGCPAGSGIHTSLGNGVSGGPWRARRNSGVRRGAGADVDVHTYGGFEHSLTPADSGSYEELHGACGKLWLERGGVFVLANIRRGGEFGPAWHNSVLRENRSKCCKTLRRWPATSR